MRKLKRLNELARARALSLNYVDPASSTNTLKLEPREVVWIEDDYPTGATPKVNGGNEPSAWVGQDVVPARSGARASQAEWQRSAPGLFHRRGLNPWSSRLAMFCSLTSISTPRTLLNLSCCNSTLMTGSSAGTGVMRMPSRMGPKARQENCSWGRFRKAASGYVWKLRSHGWDFLQARRFQVSRSQCLMGRPIGIWPDKSSDVIPQRTPGYPWPHG